MFLLSYVTDYLIEYNRYLNIVGIFVLLGIAWLFSHKRSAINLKTTSTAFVLHIVLAFFVLRTALGMRIIGWVADAVGQLYGAAETGIQFVFGGLADSSGPWGFIFAFKVLPIIIFFGAFMSLLFHWGIVQRAVGAINYCLQPLLGTSGAETLCAIANSFLGQTEAPLLIKHYIKEMTRSEIMLVMISGMGSISGAILVVYAAIGVPVVHLLSASVMAVPATILISKILYPETEQPKTMAGAAVEVESTTQNVLDAISMGASDGLQLALNVAAMLIAFIALIGLINSMLGFFCGQLGFASCITLQTIFGVVFAPFGWLLGLTGYEITAAGELIGIKVAVNEMVAYTQMVAMNLSPRAVALLTYALCGFSNFSCIGIQIGGIGALAPTKRAVLSELGFRAVLGGTLANLLSAMVAGLLL
jgi:CNT family concentrative nucleoside transporter